VKEYARIVRALAPSTPATLSNETIGVLCLRRPLVKVDLPPIVDDFQPETKVTLD